MTNPSSNQPSEATGELKVLNDPVEDTRELEALKILSEDTGDFHVLNETQAPATEPPAPEQAAKPVNRIKLTALGDFRLLAKLGEGGMGTVYKAQQISTKRLVALKVLSQAVAKQPGFLDRFRREVRILARLSHPHIIRYLAAGDSHGFTYLAMELAEGGNLSHVLAQLGILAPGDALLIAITCASALKYAHEQNLVHRDVKPDNILFTKAGALKLTDLGLARATDDSDTSLTRTGTGVGTPLYTAPEQARDAKRVDARSDIYSLGCVLYHCLTGRSPFEGTNLLQMVMAKEKGKYPLATELNAKLPDCLNPIIARMIEKNVDKRYQTCAELIDELTALKLASEKFNFVSAE
jgi:serine/threonine-protein kinase